MTNKYQKAYKKLKAMGCPVLERSDVEGFLISAEEGEKSDAWCDYYHDENMGAIFMELGIPYKPDDWIFGVNPKIIEVLKPLGLMAEWENPGALIVCEE